MITRSLFLGFFCILISSNISAQVLDWLVEPEEFLPPGDITMTYNNSSCTDEFQNCMWSGILDGETMFQTWDWEVIPDVHFSYQMDCLYEIVYDFLPCSDAIDDVANNDFASGGQHVAANSNSILTSTVCVTIIDGCNDDPDLEYCFDVTIQCGDCGSLGNIFCSTAIEAGTPIPQGGCKLCDPIDLAQGYTSCTPPCGWPNCPSQGSPQPMILCNNFISNDISIPYNMSWFAFVASDEQSEVTVEVFNCIGTGVKSGIYTDQDFSECSGFAYDCTNAESIAYTATLEVGQTYYLFVDGCNGSNCEYTLTVEGLTELIPDEIDAITATSYCSEENLTMAVSGSSQGSVSGACDGAGEITVCPGDLVQFNAVHQGNNRTFPGYEDPCSNYPPGLDAYFQWSASWGETWEYNPYNERSDQIIPPVQMPMTDGLYTICLDFIDYECYPVVGPACLEIEVVSGLSQEYFVDNDGDGFGTGDPVLFTCAAPAGYVCVDGDCDDNDPRVNVAMTPPSPNLTCNENGEEVIFTWEETNNFTYEIDLSLNPPNLATELIAPGQLRMSGFVTPCQYGLLSIVVTDPAAPQCATLTETRPCRPSPKPSILFDFSSTQIEFLECESHGVIQLGVNVNGMPNPPSGDWGPGQGDPIPEGYTFNGPTATFNPANLSPGIYSAVYTYTNPNDGCLEIAQSTFVIIECIDNDGDGSLAGDDCDDNDADVYPGSTEVCDGKDNNCDGIIDEGFSKTAAIIACSNVTNSEITFTWDELVGARSYTICVNSNVVGTQNQNFYTVSGLAPAELIEFGVVVNYGDFCESEKTLLSCVTTNATDNDNDGFLAGDDCDDNDPEVYPGNIEVCDGKDNNCDGIIDEGFAKTTAILTCSFVSNFEMTFNWDDVPGAIGYMICVNGTNVGVQSNTEYMLMGLAQNETVELGVIVSYSDQCESEKSLLSCTTTSVIDNDGDGSPAGVDCDDSDPRNFPGNFEVCDGRDNNCDGMIDEGFGNVDLMVSCATVSSSEITVQWNMITAALIYYVYVDNNYVGSSNTDSYTIMGLNPDEMVDIRVDVLFSNGCPQQSTDINCVTGIATDNDGDGSPAGTDCDDNDPNNFPGNPEVCDRKDNNCNGIVDEGFDREAAVLVCDIITDDSVTFVWDMVAGATGYIVCYNGQLAPEQQENTFSLTGLAPQETVELGVIVSYGMGCESDKVLLSCTTTNTIDNDGDGSPAGTDCDDNDPNNFPGNDERCDGADNNCDGQIDEGLIFVTYYSDNDMDGYGVDGTGFEECLQPPDTTTEAGDCDDNDPSINPNAMEIPNNTVDENCDGVVEIIDLDGDGWNSDLDCDDTNAAINPGAIEVPGNGIDEDCDGEDGGSAVHELDGQKISIFPNPVTDKLYIDTEIIGLQYSILSADGAMLRAGELMDQTLDFSALASGIYFITIHNGDRDKVVIERVVKL